jgi:hypothetical protein
LDCWFSVKFLVQAVILYFGIGGGGPRIGGVTVRGGFAAGGGASVDLHLLTLI